MEPLDRRAAVAAGAALIQAEHEPLQAVPTLIVAALMLARLRGVGSEVIKTMIDDLEDVAELTILETVTRKRLNHKD
jgi:hypothetical protein